MAILSMCHFPVPVTQHRHNGRRKKLADEDGDPRNDTKSGFVIKSLWRLFRRPLRPFRYALFEIAPFGALNVGSTSTTQLAIRESRFKPDFC